MLVNRSIPGCTVVPELAYPSISDAINWLSDAFGLALRVRIGDHRAQMNVGDGAVVLTEGSPNQSDMAHSVLVSVEDVNRHCEQARSKISPGIGGLFLNPSPT